MAKLVRDGVVVFEGEIENGGSTGEVLTSGGSVTIADGSYVQLKLTHSSGPNLLDYADETAPTIIETGIYAICFEAAPDAGGQAQGTFQVELDLGPVLSMISAFPLLGPGNPLGSVAATWYMVAGQAIKVWVGNFVGDSTALAFGIAAGGVQRLA